jgi:hypothetical protein
MAETTILPGGVVIRGAIKPGCERVLTPDAVAFAVELERAFGAERRRLLTRRAALQKRLDAGWKLDFLPETKAIRDGDWRVAAILASFATAASRSPARPINALNCGANVVFMADFEDAFTATWENLIVRQANLCDAVRRIVFDDPETGRHYSLNDKTAVLFVRPRGWHLPEKHVLVNGEPMSGAPFDFALFFFPQRQGAGGARHRPVLLPAEDRELSRSAALERPISARPGETGAAQGNDPRNRAGRDLRSYSLLLIKTCHRREIRGLAARHRLRAALQPDGGRCDRRDQPSLNLAMDPPCREARAVPENARRGIGEICA